MVRLNLEGQDITKYPEHWDNADHVELKGEEYDGMLARIEAASMTVNRLKDLLRQIQENLVDSTGTKKGVIDIGKTIIIPEHTGGIKFGN